MLWTTVSGWLRGRAEPPATMPMPFQADPIGAHLPQCSTTRSTGDRPADVVAHAAGNADDGTSKTSRSSWADGADRVVPRNWSSRPRDGTWRREHPRDGLASWRRHVVPGDCSTPRGQGAITGNADTSMPRACPAKSGAVCRPVVLLRSRITDEAPPGGRRPRDDAEGHVVTCAERHRAPGVGTCPTRATTRPGARASVAGDLAALDGAAPDASGCGSSETALRGHGTPWTRRHWGRRRS